MALPLVDFFKRTFQGIKGLGTDFDNLGNGIKGLWNDFTGQTAVNLQNEANLKMAQYQNQINEEMYNKYQSPEAIMRQYNEAGLNPNLVYGSASAGISSAPKSSLPHVERNLSGAEKTNAALSALSQVFAIGQGMYNMAAAKEVAQQSAIKTMDDDVKYRNNALDYILKSDMLGAGVSGRRPINFAVVGDTYSRYLGEYRASKFNDFLRKGMQNIYDFGGSSDPYGNLSLSEYQSVPYYMTRNKFNWLKYSLMDEIGNMGQYGKLVISLLDLLK